MPFAVSAHRLLKDGASVPLRKSPNVGGTCRPRFLVMHFTAGGYDGAVSWLCNPAAKASAHLVVGEGGEVTQLVGFDRTAWHAGRSEWAGVNGLNPVSIGIELANYGELSGAPGRWTGPGGRPVPDARVKIARHANGGRETGWHTYPAAQLAAALDIARALHAVYHFEDVVGHDQIAPHRKTDPGPAFDMPAFRRAVLGRDGLAAIAPNLDRLAASGLPVDEHDGEMPSAMA